MDIKYLGHASFRLRGKQAALVTDPFDSSSVGLKYPLPTADIITISHNHADHNAIDNVKPKNEGETPIVLRGPGEYEIKGVKIYGFKTFHDREKGAQRGVNTIYLFDVDGVRILHCGDLGHTLSDELLEELDEIDVLLIPVGGVFTIDAADAAKVIRQIEPGMVVPMHYKVPGMHESLAALSGVDVFLKEMDAETVVPLDKLTVTPASFTSEEIQVIVLKQ
ncbi:MBL fold metallo-hydrolase [Candidatus Roizmanbacteria bacterium]|nr:MBL fold metallo-hydrolase [Candidatus Roizmanbacteria bacterium]